MKITRIWARRMLFWGGLALVIWPVYELWVRLDAMYGPLKMFWDMAIGERIPFTRAIGYVDWSIFETPLYLLGRLLLGLFSLGLRRKKKASLLCIPFAVALGIYGFFDTPLFPIATFQMLKTLPFLTVTAGGCLHMLANIKRRKRARQRKAERPIAVRESKAA